MKEHFSFANNAEGLAQAWTNAVYLRRSGWKTRLATRQLTHVTKVVTVVATPPPRPTRDVRLAGFLNNR